MENLHMAKIINKKLYNKVDPKRKISITVTCYRQFQVHERRLVLPTISFLFQGRNINTQITDNLGCGHVTDNFMSKNEDLACQLSHYSFNNQRLYSNTIKGDYLL